MTTDDLAQESFEKSRTLPNDHLPVFASTRYSTLASYLDVACDKLDRAATSLRIDAAERARMAALLRRLCSPWGNAPVGRPRYYSNVSLEGMPFELSYAWGGERGYELRMSFETLSEPPDPCAGLDACRAFTRRLADEPGVSLESYLKIEDLVISRRAQGMAPMAHGIAWCAGASRPAFKIYLNPNIHGYEEGLERTRQAMSRLGVGEPWRALEQHLAALGMPPPRPVVIALDLADPASSRIKVYLPHFEDDAASIDRQATVAMTHVAGRFEHALHRVTGRTTAGWLKMPVTCMTFAVGADLPVSATLYVPLAPDVADDAAARDRVCALVRDEGGDPSSYVALLEALADRPLSDAATHNFVSYRPGDPSRFAVYLAPDVYRAPAAGAAR